MSILFMDSGGDHYASADELNKWSQGRLCTIVSGGRTGSNRLQGTNFTVAQTGVSNCTLVKNLNYNYGTLYAGIAFFQNRSGTQIKEPIMGFADSLTYQMCLYLNVNGSLSVGRGGLDNGVTPVILATSNVNIFRYAVWHYIEFKSVFATDATGSFIVMFNGIEILNVPNILTSTNTHAYANQFYIPGNKDAFHYFDDIYVADDQFYGDQAIQMLFPVGLGTSQLSHFPVSSINWQDVDDSVPDADTTYVYGSTVGLYDVYAMTHLAGAATSITALQTIVDARKDDAGTRQAAPVISSGVTLGIGSAVGLSANYVFYLQQWMTDPNTGIGWTVGAVNSLQQGIQIIA